MKNTSIFQQFDMVVSMTQQTINDQLAQLLATGTIQPTLIIAQVIENNNYVYKVLDDESDIPAGCAYINANILPQVNIPNSGLDITFVLNLVSGTAGFWAGNGPLAQLTVFDIDNWAYGIDVNMDLYKLQQDDNINKLKVPQLVQDQLTVFTDNMFSVNALLMDFESVDLIQFNPTHTTAGKSGDVGIQQMVLFMQFYLKWLIASGNPYILGYAINQTDSTIIPEGKSIPDQLKPVGTTYSMYEDAGNADKSNLNFVLATKGGFGAITGSPGTFDTNWIGTDEDINAKMIISHTDLVEALILKPLYDTIQTNVFKQIDGKIDAAIGNTYDVARAPTASGLSFTISNIDGDDNKYINTMNATFSNKADDNYKSLTIAEISVSGNIQVYKAASKNLGAVTAEAHAGISVDWNTDFTIQATKDADDLPILTLDQTFSITPHEPDTYENFYAKTATDIGDVLGSVLDLITQGFGLDKDYFTHLLDGVMGLHIPNVGDITTALANISNSIQANVILPGGQVFFFKNPSSDNEGNIYLQLTYKADH